MTKSLQRYGLRLDEAGDLVRVESPMSVKAIVPVVDSVVGQPSVSLDFVSPVVGSSDSKTVVASAVVPVLPVASPLEPVVKKQNVVPSGNDNLSFKYPSVVVPEEVSPSSAGDHKVNKEKKNKESEVADDVSVVSVNKEKKTNETKSVNKVSVVSSVKEKEKENKDKESESLNEVPVVPRVNKGKQDEKEKKVYDPGIGSSEVPRKPGRLVSEPRPVVTVPQEVVEVTDMPATTFEPPEEEKSYTWLIALLSSLLAILLSIPILNKLRPGWFRRKPDARKRRFGPRMFRRSTPVQPQVIYDASEFTITTPLEELVDILKSVRDATQFDLVLRAYECGHNAGWTAVAPAVDALRDLSEAVVQRDYAAIYNRLVELDSGFSEVYWINQMLISNLRIFPVFSRQHHAQMLYDRVYKGEEVVGSIQPINEEAFSLDSADDVVRFNTYVSQLNQLAAVTTYEQGEDIIRDLPVDFRDTAVLFWTDRVASPTPLSQTLPPSYSGKGKGPMLSKSIFRDPMVNVPGVENNIELLRSSTPLEPPLFGGSEPISMSGKSHAISTALETDVGLGSSRSVSYPGIGSIRSEEREAEKHNHDANTMMAAGGLVMAGAATIGGLGMGGHAVMQRRRRAASASRVQQQVTDATMLRLNELHAPPNTLGRGTGPPRRPRVFAVGRGFGRGAR